MLLEQILEEFCPRWTPAGRVLYVGDAGRDGPVFEAEALGISVCGSTNTGSSPISSSTSRLGTGSSCWRPHLLTVPSMPNSCTGSSRLSRAGLILVSTSPPGPRCASTSRRSHGRPRCGAPTPRATSSSSTASASSAPIPTTAGADPTRGRPWRCMRLMVDLERGRSSTRSTPTQVSLVRSPSGASARTLRIALRIWPWNGGARGIQRRYSRLPRRVRQLLSDAEDQGAGFRFDGAPNRTVPSARRRSPRLPKIAVRLRAAQVLAGLPIAVSVAEDDRALQDVEAVCSSGPRGGPPTGKLLALWLS